jgi:hypothetical protein
MWAVCGRRACTAGDAGPPSYTAGLRTPAISTAPPWHTAALTTLTRCRRTGAASRARWAGSAIATSGAAKQCQRWLSLDPRAHGRLITSAVPSATRGAALHDPAVRGLPEGPLPMTLSCRSPDRAALVSPRPWSAYRQLICNEPASSRPLTAKRPATNRWFHCHGACNVTPAREPADQPGRLERNPGRRWMDLNGESGTPGSPRTPNRPGCREASRSHPSGTIDDPRGPGLRAEICRSDSTATPRDLPFLAVDSDMTQPFAAAPPGRDVRKPQTSPILCVHSSVTCGHGAP